MPTETAPSFRNRDPRRPAFLSGRGETAQANGVRPEAIEEPASWSHPARDAARRSRVPSWALAADLA